MDNPAEAAETAAETARQWTAVLTAVVDVVAAPAEEGSVLNQLRRCNAAPQLEQTLRVLVGQGAEFLHAAIRVTAADSTGPRLSPVAPLARAGLLAFSKTLAVVTPLCWATRGVGPVLQHDHDNLVEAFLEQDRDAVFAPETASSTLWKTTGRDAILARLNGMRTALGMRQVAADGAVRPGHRLVTEGSWVNEGHLRSDEVRHLRADPSSESAFRMRWAWHRASVVAHAGFAATATPDGLSHVYLNPTEASALIRYALELAVSSRVVLGGVWSAAAAPASFDFNADHRVPRNAPHLDLP